MLPSRLGRKAYTCIPCRQRKIRCDRHKICGHCTRKKLECVWPKNAIPLEDEIVATATSTVIPERVEREPTSSTAGAGPSRVLQHSGLSEPRETPEVVGFPQTVASAEQLDHSILNDNRRTPSPSPWNETRAQAHSNFPFGRSGRSRSSGMVTDRLLSYLPARELADTMLRTYLERVEWIHHPLHVPTFVAQYNKFWDMDNTNRKVKVHARWIALLYTVLCLGAHFGDDTTMNNPHIERDLFDASQESLSVADFLNEACHETIQTIICLNLYLNNKDQVVAARGLLAMAIRMGQSMGLSRIPEEREALGQAGAFNREMGRRLWWSLVCQDAYTASNSGFSYLINLNHSSTGRFANLDDEEIQEGPSIPRSRSTQEATSSTYHLFKIDFAITVRDFIDAINASFPDAQYSDILILDKRFRDLYDALPRFLRPDLAQPFTFTSTGSRRHLVEQRIFMGVTLHNRILRLHRAYMSKGYDEERYAYSRDTSLASAYALLELVNQCRDMLCRWWVVLVHVWTSGLVLSVDMVKNSQADVTRQKSGILLAISLLEPASMNSPVAARGVKVLRSLLKQRPLDQTTRDASHRQRHTPLSPVSAPATQTDLFAIWPMDNQFNQDVNLSLPPGNDDETAFFIESLFNMDFSDSGGHMPSSSDMSFGMNGFDSVFGSL